MRLWLSILLCTSVSAHAFEMEAFGGVRSVTFDEVSEANRTGFSLRTKFNWYGNGHGPFLSVSTNFYTIGGDYGVRSTGDWFFEAAGGLAYSLIGPSPLVVLGTGYKITENWHVSFPIVYAGLLYWSPYIGYRF